MDKSFKEFIATDRVYTCERHFASDDIEICKYLCLFLVLLLDATVLCKSNESEFRRISSIVLANFRQYVGEFSRGILRRSMRYFEENAAK